MSNAPSLFAIAGIVITIALSSFHCPQTASLGRARPTHTAFYCCLLRCFLCPDLEWAEKSPPTSIYSARALASPKVCFAFNNGGRNIEASPKYEINETTLHSRSPSPGRHSLPTWPRKGGARGSCQGEGRLGLDFCSEGKWLINEGSRQASVSVWPSICPLCAGQPQRLKVEHFC